jgi:hypothetical protein
MRWTVARVSVVSFLAGVALATAFLAAHGGDASRLVHAAIPATDPALAPKGLTVQGPDDSFDGQFYYRIAVRPLSTAPRVEGVSLDLPAVRTQRIAYPLLARALALGDPGRIVSTLVIVNVLALTVVGHLGARIAVALGRDAGWGLLFAAYPGFVYTMGFDLVELTELSFVLLALWAVLRRRPVVATAALVGACLTKETGLILAVGIGLAWVIARVRSGARPRPTLVDLAPAAVPAVVFSLWQLVLRHRFGVLPLHQNANNNVAYPFGGFIKVIDRFTPTSGANLFRDLSLALLIGVAALTAIAWRRSKAPLAVRLAWLGSVALLMFLSAFVVEGATSFMRAGAESYVLGLVIVLGADLSFDWLLVPSVGALAALTVGSELVKAK